MAMQIIKEGILDTIQNTGRYGKQFLGINPGGVMDRIAHKTANVLVGNHPDEAVLEMHFPAATIRFNDDGLLALSGADFNAIIDRAEIAINQPIVVNKNAVLRFTKKKKGARCYLAIRGGLDSPRFPYHFSGEQNTVALPWKADLSGLYTNGPIRMIPGSFFQQLMPDSRERLFTEHFSISPQSNRMGYRLTGNNLVLEDRKELISSAVTRGTIQLLPSGQLIILMADHQTTGGYPCIGHVISADIPSLAQMESGQAISFQPVTNAEAERLWLHQEQHLHQLQYSCNFRMQEYFAS